MAVSGSAWDMLSRKNTAYNHSRVRFSVSAFSARVSHELPRLRPSRPEAASTAPDEVAVAAQTAAVAAYEAIGCHGLCRADFIVREDGVPVFLEINTLPGMTATSLSPMAAGATGVSFEDLVERILQGAHHMEAETA